MTNATLESTIGESGPESRELSEREATDALARALAGLIRTPPEPAGWIERRSGTSPLTTRHVTR